MVCRYLNGSQIAVTVITHAEKQGMSVLREGASNQEFERTITERIRNDPKRWFHGIASLRCAAVRSLVATSDTDQRDSGDRLYCVLDADMDALPHHADI